MDSKLVSLALLTLIATAGVYYTFTSQEATDDISNIKATYN